jgi:hypothetical protein
MRRANGLTTLQLTEHRQGSETGSVEGSLASTLAVAHQRAIGCRPATHRSLGRTFYAGVRVLVLHSSHQDSRRQHM